MIEEEKKTGVEPIVYFIIVSVLIHALLFYIIPKLPKPPSPKSQKPISVKFIEEKPVKGKKKPPKKASVLGKQNITVKKEMRPENKPKIEGSKKTAKLLPPPPPPVRPQKPTAPKPQPKKPAVKIAKPPVKAAPKPQKKVPPPPKKPKVVTKKPTHLAKKEIKPKKEILSSRRKGSFKVAEARPKKRVSKPTAVPPKKKAPPTHKPARHAAPVTPKKEIPTAPAPGRAQPPVTRKAPPTPVPHSLFPSQETLHQIERKFSQTFPKNVPKGDVISLNTKSYKYISYFTHIKRKIELVWEYPREAVEMGQEGTLVLRFTILKDGRLAGVWLVQSSGYRLLDEEAINAVKEAAPFNPIPDRLKKDHLNIEARFTYSLGFKFVY